VVLPFSELPDPACEAADPAELLVSTCVPAGDVPVCAWGLPTDAVELVPVCPAGVWPVPWVSPSPTSGLIFPAEKATTSAATARLLSAAESIAGSFGIGGGFGVVGLIVKTTVRGVFASWKVGVHWIFP